MKFAAIIISIVIFVVLVAWIVGVASMGKPVTWTLYSDQPITKNIYQSDDRNVSVLSTETAYGWHVYKVSIHVPFDKASHLENLDKTSLYMELPEVCSYFKAMGIDRLWYINKDVPCTLCQ